MRATKGAAAIESGTIAATVPIEVLTISLDNGKSTIIRIKNGKERRTSTILFKTLLSKGFGIIPVSESVTHIKMPSGNPRITEKHVEKKTIIRVCHVAVPTKVKISV